MESTVRMAPFFCANRNARTLDSGSGGILNCSAEGREIALSNGAKRTHTARARCETTSPDVTEVTLRGRNIPNTLASAPRDCRTHADIQERSGLYVGLRLTSRPSASDEGDPSAEIQCRPLQKGVYRCHAPSAFHRINRARRAEREPHQRFGRYAASWPHETSRRAWLRRQQVLLFVTRSVPSRTTTLRLRCGGRSALSRCSQTWTAGAALQ